jgi:hypothetical protein
MDNGGSESLDAFVYEESVVRTNMPNQQRYQIVSVWCADLGYPFPILLRTHFSPSSYATLAFQDGNETLTAYMQVSDRTIRTRSGA